MSAIASQGRGKDGRLWAIAFGLSLLVNVAILGMVGITAIRAELMRKSMPVPASPAAEKILTIFPELPGAKVDGKITPPPQEPAKPRFARTSPDQTSPAPASAAFIGERDTQATSDRAPDATAPALPSQAGIDQDDLETTESRYQDGRLGDARPSQSQQSMPAPPAPVAPDPAIAENSVSGEVSQSPGTDTSKSSPPPAPGEKLLQGTSPVDVPVPRTAEAAKEIKPTPAKRPKDGASSTKPTELPKPATAAKPINDPAFAGYQRKAAIVGSISRTGRSALNVADSPLGRYQAVISRAVELEWQRNCVRHRDFITPGFLTVRFFVEPSGKVRTVQFLGQMETGEVQKGFTLNSIRDADIPAMPAAVKKDFDREPLELIFNFYF